MQDQLSVWYLVSNAGLMVQFVMLTLVLASVVSWGVIFQRLQIFRKTRLAQKAFDERFWSGMDLGQLYKEVSASPTPHGGTENVFRAGFREFTRMRQQSQDAHAVMDGTERAMRVAISREMDKLEQHLPFLATVGSTSPYVGLFGTVWGIMNSFLGLAQVQQPTLQTVAPGIAEALIATAMGLFAAIPAVISFNRFTANADAQVKQYETFSEEFSSILHRRVHGGQ